MTNNSDNSRPRRGIWRNIVLVLRAVVTAFRRHGKSGSPLMAAAIAFYSVICLGPLGILLSAVLEWIFGKGTYAWVESALNQFDTTAVEQVMAQVKGLLEGPDLFISGPLSALVLIWAGLRLFETVERSLTEIWPGKILRGIVGRKLMSLAMMAVAGALLTLFVLANAFFARLHGLLQEAALRFPEVDADKVMQAQPNIMVVLGFLLSLLAFSLLYKYMPVQRVPKRAALAGALCAAILWQAASGIFTYFLRLPTYNNAMYGGLAGVVVFSMWAFLGAQMLLFGAHFAAAFNEIVLGGGAPENDDTDPATPPDA